MQYEVGAVFEGTVVDVVKFGAFVKLSGGKTGLVHISQISDKYVQEIADHVSVGAKVLVKIISIDDKKRIQLSMKGVTKEDEENLRQKEKERQEANAVRAQQRIEASERNREEYVQRGHGDSGRIHAGEEDTFERKMKMFIRQSEDRQVDIKRNIESKRGVKKRKHK